MALQLKTEDTESMKAQGNHLREEASPDDGEGMEQPYNPVVISTYVPTVPDAKKESGGALLVKFVVAVIVCGILFLIGKTISNKLKKVDITEYVNKTEEQIADFLDADFEDTPEKISSVHQYGNGIVSVRSAKDISIVYLDGRQLGVKTDSKKYEMFGVKIGDSELSADRNMTYDADASFVVADDIMSGNSTSNYYYNSEKNDCFLIIVNDNTNRVVSMTYYNDYRTITENLSGIDE